MPVLAPRKILCIEVGGMAIDELRELIGDQSTLLNAELHPVTDYDAALVELRRCLAGGEPYALVLLGLDACENQWHIAQLWDIDPLVRIASCSRMTASGAPTSIGSGDRRLFKINLEAPPNERLQLLELLLDNGELLRRKQRKPDGATRDLPARDGSRSKASVAANARDPLTSLPNRKMLYERLGHELERARGDVDYEFAVLLLNLDRFKVINASFGHRRADSLLVDVSRHLEDTLRSTDMVCRVGGDEFAVVLSETHNLADIYLVARRVLAAPSTRIDLEGRGVDVTATIGGVTITGQHSRTPDDILRKAGLALAQAKARGGSRVEFYEPSDYRDRLVQLELESHLLRGMEREEFFLHYQPIISIADKAIAGFEALLRWNHPEMGNVPPGVFVPILEQNGLINPLGEWIISRACFELTELLERSSRPLYLTLNVSQRQLARPGFASRALSAIERSGVSPGHIGFEITETAVLDDYRAAVENIAVLREAGIRIFIDDFGVGQSSLHSLHRLPIDALKLDRSFITGMVGSSKGQAIVQKIVEMGHALAVPLVAEGIELEAERACVEAVSCDFGQGYLFSKPIGLTDACRLLATDRSGSSQRQAFPEATHT